MTILEKTPLVTSNQDVRKDESIYFHEKFVNHYRLVTNNRESEFLTTNQPIVTQNHDTEVMSLTKSQLNDFRKKGIHFEQKEPSDLIYSFSKFNSNFSKPVSVKRTLNNDIKFLNLKDESITVDLAERVKYETAKPYVPGPKMNTGLMDSFIKSNLNLQVSQRLRKANDTTNMSKT